MSLKDTSPDKKVSQLSILSLEDKEIEDSNRQDPIELAEGGYSEFLPAWALTTVEIKAVVTKVTKDEDGKETFEKFPIFDTIDALNANMAKDVLTQFENLTMARIHHYAQLGEFATILFKKRKLANVLVHVRRRSFYAHKHVLCCHSGFFEQTLIEHSLPPNTITDVTLKNVNPSYFKDFLHFCYYGEICLNDKNIPRLLNLCNKLHASMLRARIHAYLAVHGELHPALVKRILMSKNDTDRPLAILEAIHNFGMFHEDLKTLGRVAFKDIMEILSSNDLNVKSELDVFWAALMWVAYDVHERFNLMDTLMSNVRMTCMSTLELLDISRATSLIRFSKMCKQHIMSATWVCHAREMGLEDPLGLPKEKPRRSLVNKPVSMPSTEEFNKRYLQYKKLVGDVNIEEIAKTVNTREHGRNKGIVFADEIGGDLEFVQIAESRPKEEVPTDSSSEKEAKPEKVEHVLEQWQGVVSYDGGPQVPPKKQKKTEKGSKLKPEPKPSPPPSRRQSMGWTQILHGKLAADEDFKEPEEPEQIHYFSSTSAKALGFDDDESDDDDD